MITVTRLQVKNADAVRLGVIGTSETMGRLNEHVYIRRSGRERQLTDRYVQTDTYQK